MENINIIEKTYNKREKDQAGNPLVSYACKLIKPANIALGDVVTLEYIKLDIDTSVHIAE